MHLNITEKAGALGLLLERGFSESAARELRGIIDDSRLSPLDRASAAWVLSRHCYIGGRFDRALNLLETCDDLTSGGPKFAGQEESHIICLARLGRYGPARERLERLLEGVAADSPPAHLFFLYATVLRGQMLAAGAPLDEIEAVQLGHINRVLTAGGLAPLTKKNPEKPLALDNIQAPSAAPADLSAQPLVSVIMPAYNAAGTIQTGLEGLLAQTWTNLEIIVVDDASTDNTAGIVSQMARRDERLRLMQQPVNQGTYRARNRGVLEARGDLITVCDSDDWPHPQRTEILTRHLLNKPNLATVRGRWIRVGRHLETGRNWLPTAAFTSDPTSHIYRREMFEEIGPWDDGIRIGADTELVDRVFRTYGPGTTEEINSPAPLLLSREYEGSLTRTGPTHLRTMAHAAGARFHYFKAYRHWHLKTLAAGKKPNIHEKTFSVPPAIRPVTAAGPYDLAVAANFSLEGGAGEEILRQSLARWRKTAIINWPDYCAEPQAAVIHERIYDLCFGGGIDILSSADRVRAETLLFVPPLNLEHFLDALPGLSFEKAEIPGWGALPGPASLESLLPLLRQIDLERDAR